MTIQPCPQLIELVRLNIPVGDLDLASQIPSTIVGHENAHSKESPLAIDSTYGRFEILQQFEHWALRSLFGMHVNDFRLRCQMKRLLSLIALVIIASDCSSITGGCAKPQTEEITYNDPYHDVKVGFIDAWRKQGYTCTSVAIRDAFGNQIGDSYTCTKC